jgi:hypothetical protein
MAAAGRRRHGAKPVVRAGGGPGHGGPPAGVVQAAPARGGGPRAVPCLHGAARARAPPKPPGARRHHPVGPHTGPDAAGARHAAPRPRRGAPSGVHPAGRPVLRPPALDRGAPPLGPAPRPLERREPGGGAVPRRLPVAVAALRHLGPLGAPPPRPRPGGRRRRMARVPRGTASGRGPPAGAALGRGGRGRCPVHRPGGRPRRRRRVPPPRALRLEGPGRHLPRRRAGPRRGVPGVVPPMAVRGSAVDAHPGSRRYRGGDPLRRAFRRGSVPPEDRL